MQKYLPANKRLRELMRVCTLQLLLAMIVCGISLAHPNYAQKVLNREVTITLTEVTIEKALLEIEVIAKVKFVYGHERLKLDETISLKAEKMKLGELLTNILTPRGIEFTGNDESNFVVLKPGKNKDREQSGKKTSDANAELGARGREVNYATVTGTVTDGSTNLPMPGVNVIVKGTTNGTSTDSEGRYSITTNDNDILVFSFIGFTTQEILVSSRNVVDIILLEDATKLNEVVVKAGYWEIKNEEKTGNISRVTAETIAQQPVSNPLLAGIGRIPGVMISQQSGIPGGAVNIQIRGQNSLRNLMTDNGNLPFYIVDGIPFVSTSLSDVTTGGEILRGASPLNFINPSDIESIEILKDADATAIYGSRGSNGVVLITTKKASSSRTVVDVNFYSGIAQVNKKLKLLNTPQYLEMVYEAFENDGYSSFLENPAYDIYYPDLKIWSKDRYTDWQEQMLGGTANINNAQLSISGGSKNTQILFSGGFYREGTVFPGNWADKKMSSHVSINHTSDNQKFRMLTSINYVVDNNDLPTADLTRRALTLPPNGPAVFDETGNLNWKIDGWRYWADGGNPYSVLVRKYTSKTRNLIGNTTLSYEIIEGLDLKANLGYTTISINELSTNPIAAINPQIGSNITGSSLFANNSIETWIAEPQIHYEHKVGEGKLNVLVGMTFQQNMQDRQSLLGYGFTSDALIENIKAAPFISINDSDYTKYRYNALFGRIHYEWRSKYFVNLTGRRDGSSRFGPDKQFANFGALGLAWIFTNEKLFKGNSFLSFGKLRTSFGITGSDQIPNYGYLDTYSANNYGYNGIAGLIPTALANPNFSWETTRKMEAALEMAFINDRFHMEVSWYNNRSSNQLVGYPLSSVTGFNSVQSNFPATVENTGLEISLNTINIKSGGFDWTTNVNFTLPKNKLVSFPNIDGSSYSAAYVVGQPLTVTQGYHSMGVNPETGLYVFKDFDGNGNGTDYPQDWKSGPALTQQFYGGISNSLSYKGVRLDFLFQFVKQTGRSYQYYFTKPGASSNQPVEVMDRWRSAGDETDIQKFTTNFTSYRNFQSSDKSVTDASFIRLKNIALSYQIPIDWASALRVKTIRVYVQCQNLFTITGYKALDPESQNIESLPPLQVITGGLQVTF